MPRSATSTSSPVIPAPHMRKEGLVFLRSLVRINRRDPVEAREWFQGRKQVFEDELKAPMLAIIRQVTDAMADFAPDHVRPPEKSLFRIYRDTRFSNDKRPYKDHIGAWWTHSGLGKTSGAGFYFHVSGREVTVAAGVYMPEKDQLSAIRHWLLDHHEEFRGIIEKPALRKAFREFEGTPLSRPPKGFPAELDGKPHPAIDLIRCRQWGVGASLPAEAALEPDFAKQITRHFKLAAPLVAALNTPIIASLADGKDTRKRVLFGLTERPNSGKTR